MKTCTLASSPLTAQLAENGSDRLHNSHFTRGDMLASPLQELRPMVLTRNRVNISLGID
jgi:hypothetical protein